MIIPIKNTLHENVAKTYLAQNEPSGAASVRWKNPNGFGTQWAIQLGETGFQTSEVVILGTQIPSLYAGTLQGTTNYDHAADTSIYAIKYDQVVFLRSTAGTAGTAVVLTDGTVNYTPNSDLTRFEDTAGSPSYTYKVYFQSSVTSGTSELSDWITIPGPTFYSLAKLRQRIKDKLWNSNYVDDHVIDDWINEWKDQMVNEVIKLNEDYAMGTVDISFGSNGLGTISTADFMSVRRFDVTYNSAEYFKATHQYENSYFPDQVYSSTNPCYNYLGDNVFRVKPVESGGIARLSFYRFGTTLVNDTDELPMPMRSFTDSFVDYGLAQALFKDEKAEMYQLKMGLCKSAKEDFVTKIVPRDRNTPATINMVEAGSGDSYPII